MDQLSPLRISVEKLHLSQVVQLLFATQRK